MGRVGRAFVDLDGLYVLPIFEKTQRAAMKRLSAFRNLKRDSMNRQLESGVRELIGYIIAALRERLGCSSVELAEYVLNADSPWLLPPKDGDNFDEGLDLALNELDTSIFGIVDVLDLPTKDVADYLDTCLKSSYWQRRLKNQSVELQELQNRVLKGRAVWLWGKTNVESRRAYFASGVGYKAGLALESSLDSLAAHLTGAELSLEAEDVPEAAKHASSAADILFRVGPFQASETISNLPDLLGHWLSGSALSQYADPAAVGFIQENIVYRLVWGVEAARLHVEHVAGGGEDSPGGLLALCLTYGVPSRKAAVLVQAGLRSRRLAAAAAKQISEDFSDHEGLHDWIFNLRSRLVEGPSLASEEDRKEWRRFLARFEHRRFEARKRWAINLEVQWHPGKQPPPKSWVRVSRAGRTSSGIVLSISSLLLGTTTLPPNVNGDYFTGRTQPESGLVRIAATLTRRA